MAYIASDASTLPPYTFLTTLRYITMGYGLYLLHIVAPFRRRYRHYHYHTHHSDRLRSLIYRQKNMDAVWTNLCLNDLLVDISIHSVIRSHWLWLYRSYLLR